MYLSAYRRPHSIARDGGILESVDLTHEIFNRIFRKVPEKLS